MLSAPSISLCSTAGGLGSAPPIHAGMTRPQVYMPHACHALCPHHTYGSWTTSCSYFIFGSCSASDFCSTPDSCFAPYQVPVVGARPWSLNAHSPDLCIPEPECIPCWGHHEGLAVEVS